MPYHININTKKWNVDIKQEELKTDYTQQP
jgi:hypothetical protein